MKLSKMNVSQLREIAVSMGADKNKLYGTSKQSIILTINQLTCKARKEELEAQGEDMSMFS